MPPLGLAIYIAIYVKTYEKHTVHILTVLSSD